MAPLVLATPALADDAADATPVSELIVTGEIAFDENGDVPRQRVIIGQVRGGQVVAVEGL